MNPRDESLSISVLMQNVSLFHWLRFVDNFGVKKRQNPLF